MIPWITQAHSKQDHSRLLEFRGSRLHCTLGLSIRQEDDDARHGGIPTAEEPLPHNILESQTALCAPSSVGKKGQSFNQLLLEAATLFIKIITPILFHNSHCTTLVHLLCSHTLATNQLINKVFKWMVSGTKDQGVRCAFMA